MTVDLEQYVVARRVVGFVEVVTLRDAFDNEELVQQGLALAVPPEQVPIMADWTEANIENAVRAMQARECAFMRLARARGHALPAAVSAERQKDCGCG